MHSEDKGNPFPHKTIVATPRKIITPPLPLTPDVRIWLSEILNCYNQNIYPEEFRIYRQCVKKLSSPNFGPDKIDDRLLCFKKELNIYGIYCLDPLNRYINTVDNIIMYIKKSVENIATANEPCNFTAEELSKALEIADVNMVKVCLSLMLHVSGYYDSGSVGRNDNEFGGCAIAINTLFTAQKYLSYDSIDRILEYFYTHYGQKTMKELSDSVESKANGSTSILDEDEASGEADIKIPMPIESFTNFKIQNKGMDYLAFKGYYKRLFAQNRVKAVRDLIKVAKTARWKTVVIYKDVLEIGRSLFYDIQKEGEFESRRKQVGKMRMEKD
jgi:hypothetical protein